MGDWWALDPRAALCQQSAQAGQMPSFLGISAELSALRSPREAASRVLSFQCALHTPSSPPSISFAFVFVMKLEASSVLQQQLPWLYWVPQVKLRSSH